MATGNSITHSFKRSPVRSGVMAFLCFPMAIAAMFAGLIAWHLRSDPSFQFMNSYTFAGNAVFGVMMGVFVGFLCALVFPTALCRVRTRTILLGMLGAIAAAFVFVALTGGFPMGPVGFCLVGAALTLHLRAKRNQGNAMLTCPRCGYDTRGIAADPCPECGIGLYHALELHGQKQFLDKLFVVGLLAEGAFWAFATVWLWNTSLSGFD